MRRLLNALAIRFLQEGGSEFEVTSLKEQVAGSGERTNGSRAMYLLTGEDGMYSLLTVVAVAFLVALAAVVANAAFTINCKIEVQNGADSVAYSSSLVDARAMNAITTANHVIGELQALVVLHHAIGGDELDAGKTAQGPDDAATQANLTEAYVVLLAFAPSPSPSSDVYNRTSKLPRAGATLHDSVVRLQKVLTWTYEVWLVGAALEKVPAPVAVYAGMAVSYACKILETRVGAERKILELLENVARRLIPLKKATEMLVAGIHHGYAGTVVMQTAKSVRAVVDEVGQANAVEGAVFPKPQWPLLEPPVHEEPRQLSDMRKSQLVRASFPWVNHWRVPILQFMRECLLLARSAYFYKHYSNLFTAQKAREAKQRRGVNLYILKGLDLTQGEKGNEPWTRRSGSSQAGRLFCLVGFAHRKSPPMLGPGFFNRQNPDGIVAYAQGMIYNANPQSGPGGGSLQPRVGWDTLNWVSPVLELNMNEGNKSDEPSDQPQIRVNWQTKLVPVTRLTESVSQLNGPFREVIGRSVPDNYSFKTH
jgi:hypothetical protein